MKLCIDISQIAYSNTGVARAVCGLVDAICEHDKNNLWTFLYYSHNKLPPQNIVQTINNTRHKLMSIKVPMKIMQFFAYQVRLPIELLIGRQDIFITSDWLEFYAMKTKKATIVYDIIYKLYPEFVHPTILGVQAKRMALVAKESSYIIADSKSTKNDIGNILAINPQKVSHLYLGVKIDAKYEELSVVCSKFTIQKDYILSVGTLSPRKNIQRLINAYQKLQRNDVQLVIVGQKGWGQEYESQNVIFTGSVSDSELKTLYKHALCFAFPSIYEGFGLPLIEAMQEGVPCACSSTSSLGELAKGYALTFDPTNENDIQLQLKKILDDQVLRKNLANQALPYAKSFTWERAYKQFITILVTL
jgi:glycosyltransferase involved in cell wall biosynthesis